MAIEMREAHVSRFLVIAEIYQHGGAIFFASLKRLENGVTDIGAAGDGCAESIIEPPAKKEIFILLADAN
jgi:hypothetical protein